jgi:hypothetical protein
VIVSGEEVEKVVGRTVNAMVYKALAGGCSYLCGRDEHGVAFCETN